MRNQCKKCHIPTPNVSTSCSYGDDKYVISKFGEGEKVFILKKSKQGIFEYFTITTIHINSSKSTGGQIVVVYSDKDNRVWLERELCTEQEAINNVVLYNQKIANQ